LEDLCTDSDAAARGLHALIGALRSLQPAVAASPSAPPATGGGLSPAGYAALCERAVAVAARLLRRSDQTRLLCAAAHLFSGGSGSGAVAQPERVRWCLLRALRAAESIQPPSPGLFVGILEAALFFFEAGVPTVRRGVWRSRGGRAADRQRGGAEGRVGVAA
jgi:hypothetical protein